MALHSLYCADVPLRNCSLTHTVLLAVSRAELLVVTDCRQRYSSAQSTLSAKCRRIRTVVHFVDSDGH